LPYLLPFRSYPLAASSAFSNPRNSPLDETPAVLRSFRFLVSLIPAALRMCICMFAGDDVCVDVLALL
jgi:hypothetical protein